jgi:methionyl-tRNA formyltransferase
MRLVFLGSGAFAIPSFEAVLDAGHEVVALVTQPDREKGRGRELAAPPLKPVAESRGVRVLQPRRIKEPAAQDELRALAPEIQIVVAYGQILPRSVIEIPERRTVNVHGSLLPRYRGAAPIQWAIANGETETGVTTMLIDEGLDTGPTLLSRALPIGSDETAAQLEPRLARLGAQVLLETLVGLGAGTLTPVPQDAARATLARILRKEDGQVDWTRSAQEIVNRMRGFQPWPGAMTVYEGKGLKLMRARVEDDAPGEPGAIVGIGADGVRVACGHGTRLRLVEVQPESRRPIPAAAWAAGSRARPGSRFG